MAEFLNSYHKLDFLGALKLKHKHFQRTPENIVIQSYFGL